MTPRFPIYIPSRGRADRPITMRHLDRYGVPYRVVVEADELDAYAAALGREKLLVLEPRYQDDYEACMQLAPGQSKGSGPARNFIWDHAIAEGWPWHWIMDDNIRGFFRFNANRKIPVADGTIFRCMEDFCLRYTNVAMAGPNYFMFIHRKEQKAPFTPNTRIYSCNLIRNDVPFRWRCRYNEDTDLSLRMLKAGWCTILFNAFLQDKLTTQLVDGGNTDAFYRDEGTRPKSRMLAALHPDVARVTWRFKRWHHYVDYRPFRANKLVRRRDASITDGVDNYGMRLVALDAPSPISSFPPCR